MLNESARAQLGAICGVTYSVPDLRAIEQAYVGELGYIVVASGFVSAAQARSWGSPDSTGLPMLLLGPASGEAVYLRFVEDVAATGWRALETFGWNATEFVVQDVDALAARLNHRRSAFRIIGPPRSLTRFPMIRAMQVIGPAGECCYFTQVGPGSGMDLAAARSFVGRVFIVVGAGPDVDALFTPYAQFANAVDPPVATPVVVISNAHRLPPQTLHRHGLVRLPEGTLIELDEYPRSATVRARPEGRLPPGMAMVTFSVESGPSACLRGAAGELIEIVGR